VLNQNDTTEIGMLYLGGTIGSAGRPLTPLPADTFLPHLASILHRELVATKELTDNLAAPIKWHYFSGQIKDSSALVPEDWQEILTLLLDPAHAQIKRWIILHGTDTLSFTAAFLAAALQSTQLKVIVTGSQKPLLDPTQLSFNPNSDALDNLQSSIAAFANDQEDNGWVRVAFNNTQWIADGVQKIHTRHRIAFAGQAIDQSLMNQHTANDSINPLLKQPSRLKEALSRLDIQIYYVAPLSLDTLVSQLEKVLLSGAEGVILLAYGLGNLLDDLSIHRLLLAAEQRGVIVVLSTQVPFGGIEPRYAAGDWLAACGVLPGGSLPVSTIFARLAWQQITIKTFSERRQYWLDYITAVSHAINEQKDEF
jgi:L-asparaginase